MLAVAQPVGDWTLGANLGYFIGGEEWIRDIELAYAVQSGPLKSLNVKWRTSSMRKNWFSDGT